MYLSTPRVVPVSAYRPLPPPQRAALHPTDKSVPGFIPIITDAADITSTYTVSYCLPPPPLLHYQLFECIALYLAINHVIVMSPLMALIGC